MNGIMMAADRVAKELGAGGHLTEVATSGNFVALATAIPDVKVIRPRKFGDHRGFFSETYSVRDFASLGIADAFVQDNHSMSAPVGTLRGLHLQTPPMAQAKLVRVVRGAIIDVAVDVRRGSPTYGQHVRVTLSAAEWNQIYVPIGFAHGFVTTEPDTEVVYKVSNCYSPEHERGIRFDDPALQIDWGIDPATAVLSGRDRQHPPLADFDSPF
jgi:dTDP-4-dehydrorhamnose 3,5-epimerase